MVANPTIYGCIQIEFLSTAEDIALYFFKTLTSTTGLHTKIYSNKIVMHKPIILIICVLEQSIFTLK